MRRFASLEYTPTVTRVTLRGRIVRFLPSRSSMMATASRGTGSALRDEQLLRLYKHLKIRSNSDVDCFAARYDAALALAPHEPTFNELLARRWVHIIWGEVVVPQEMDMALRRGGLASLSAFKSAALSRYGYFYELNQSIWLDDELVATADGVRNGTIDPAQITCDHPDWVAQQMWSYLLDESSHQTVELRAWARYWKLLGSPDIIPSQAWYDDKLIRFRDAVLTLFASKDNLVSWDELRGRFVARTAVRYRKDNAMIEAWLAPVPESVIERVLWLENPSLEHLVMDNLWGDLGFSGLARLLLNDVVACEQCPVPHSVAKATFDVALDRPELLFSIIGQARHAPVLLADLLLDGRTSALACLLIARWVFTTDGWDRELQSADNDLTKAMAFSDAISIFGFLLSRGDATAADAALLFNQLHNNSVHNPVGDEVPGDPLLAALREELRVQSRENLLEMVDALLRYSTTLRADTSIFISILDIIELGQLVEFVDPDLLVGAYLESVRAGRSSKFIQRIGFDAASVLVDLAQRAYPDLHDRFLRPITGSDYEGHCEDEVRFITESALSRGLRLHIRLLCRACVGLGERPHSMVVEALVFIIRLCNGLGRKDVSLFSVFSPSHEIGIGSTEFERPIASDISATLRTLSGDDRSLLFNEVLRLNEPMVLAQLLLSIPDDLQPLLKKKLELFTPDKAAGIHSLVEAQARIDTLLSSGLFGTAELFIRSERALLTLGNVPDRNSKRIKNDLRLYYAKRDWDAIQNVKIPDSLAAHERVDVHETVEFFQALASLQRPGANRSFPEAVFQRLQAAHPNIPAYFVNLLATRIDVLLNGNVFRILTGAEKVRGGQILRDADEMAGKVSQMTSADREIHFGNRSILLLAIGRPLEAKQSLEASPVVKLHNRRIAYMAVALARLGQSRIALSMLTQAENIDDERAIQAASEHIRNGSGYAGRVSVTSTDDAVPRIKDAINMLSRLSLDQQAQALSPGTHGLVMFVLDPISCAAASLIELISSIRESAVVDRFEDDLNAIMRELIAGRIGLLGWSISDQSKGGQTVKGNPGSRDLVIRKDGTVIAVIEALICKFPIGRAFTRGDLTSHFHRLLAYGSCAIFVHLTYSYVDNPATVLAHLETSAEKDAPSGYLFRTLYSIETSDTRPPGFIAEYNCGVGVVHVAFLLIDMRRASQQSAARAARAIDPRRARPPLR